MGTSSDVSNLRTRFVHPPVGDELTTARRVLPRRDHSPWGNHVPKQRSSGGKDRLGSVSKQGDRYLRSLFTAGALAVIRYAKIHGTQHRPFGPAPHEGRRDRARQQEVSASVSRAPVTMPTSRTRSAHCARAAIGHAAAPPMRVMNSRRLMEIPRAVGS
jgi:Transposase IS116/IS110/IS902 family